MSSHAEQIFREPKRSCQRDQVAAGQHVRLDTEPIPGQGPLKLDGKNRSFAPTTTRIGTDGHASKLQTDPKTASASGSGEALPCLALHARIVSTTSGHGVAERFAPSPPAGIVEGRP